jgi:hypothetical protein
LYQDFESNIKLSSTLLAYLQEQHQHDGTKSSDKIYSSRSGDHQQGGEAITDSEAYDAILQYFKASKQLADNTTK